MEKGSRIINESMDDLARQILSDIEEDGYGVEKIRECLSDILIVCKEDKVSSTTLLFEVGFFYQMALRQYLEVRLARAEGQFGQLSIGEVNAIEDGVARMQDVLWMMWNENMREVMRNDPKGDGK